MIFVCLGGPHFGSRSVVLLFAFDRAMQGMGKIVEDVRRNVAKEICLPIYPVLTSEEVAVFAEALKKNKSVTALYTSQAKLSCEGFKAIFEALKVNETVKVFSLNLDSFSIDAARILCEALCINNSISSLYVIGSIDSEYANHKENIRLLCVALGANQSISGLTFSSFSFGAEECLCEALLKNTCVKSLTFERYSLNKDSCPVIARLLCGTQSIKSLRCALNSMGDASKLIYEAMTVNKSLTSLTMHINDCPEEDEDADIIDDLVVSSSITKMLSINTTLRVLSLSATNFGETGLKILSKEGLMMNSTLAKLDLTCWSGFNEEDGWSVFNVVLTLNKSLTYLGLSSCKLCPDQSYSIASTLRHNNVLKTLNLSNNQFGSKGAKVISAALKVNVTLTKLDISENDLNLEGSIAIGEMLTTNSTLIYLNLFRNNLRCLKEISKALCVNQSLRSINFMCNVLGDASAPFVRDILAMNKTLTEINADSNMFSSAGLRLVLGGLSQNHIIKIFECSFNDIECGNSLLDAYCLNGSILKSSNKSFEAICKRNQDMHQNAMLGCLALLAARRRRTSALSNVPKELFTIIALYLWKTRTDFIWQRVAKE